MKISIKITKDGLDSLNNALQYILFAQAITRVEKTNQSILEEVYRKTHQVRYGFVSGKPKKISLKFYQASILEYFLRHIIEKEVFSTTSKIHHEIRKIADELHQLVV